MDIDESTSRLDPVDELAEEYLRRRRGEHPTHLEYAAQYPSMPGGSLPSSRPSS